jgi:hypothetical protein
MTIRERMIYAIDLVTDGAVNGLNNLKTKLNDAGTTAGKFKVLGTEAMNQVKAHAAELALAGGAALVTFGVKSVQAFTEGALAAGKFSTASGLSVEEASRWTAVADDVGVSQEAMAAAFLKMERAVASGKGAWTEYGIEIARTSDGQVDATGTMLNAIRAVGQIEDPLKRAEVAQSLWGRGFAEVSEIVLGNAGEIEEALGNVSEAQIFDEDEVAKAREFRAAMDELKDALSDLAIAAGEVLTPAVADAAEGLADLVAVIDRVKSAGDLMPGWVKGAAKAFYEFQLPLTSVKGHLEDVAGWIGIGGDEAQDAAGKFGLLEGVVADLTESEGFLAQSAEDAVESAIAQSDAEREAAGDVQRHAEMVELLNTLFGEQVVSTEDVTEATDDFTEAISDSIDAQLEALEAQEAVTNARRAAADATFAVHEAERQFADQIATTTEQLGLSKEELEEQGITLLDLRASLEATATEAAAVADAEVRVAQETATANGEVLSAKEAQQLWNQSMLDSANALDGPMRQAVLDYIANVNGIPPEKLTEILPFLDDGSLAAAEAQLAFLTRQRFARVDVVTGGVPRYARGTSNHPGGPAIVGEQGAELVDLPAGSRVHTASQTRSMLNGGGGGYSQPIVIQLASGREVRGMIDQRDAELLAALRAG